jgi:hypothetical protein
MRKALVIAAVLLTGVIPASADQRVPDPSLSARLGALRAAQGPSPYSKLFEVRSALKQAGQDAQKSPAPRRRVVCGMTVIEVGPELDPKMAVAAPSDDKTRYTIRAVDPPVCK